MNDQPFIYRLGFIVLALVMALLIPTFIDAQQEVPPIPHNLNRREDCLDCHKTGRLKSPIIPDNHQDWSNEVCLDCHYLDTEEPKAAPPLVPHPTEFREVCTACHISADALAEPTPTPVPLPTPIIVPRIKGVDTCIDCHGTLEEPEHLDIVDQAQRGIHAERDISCADCHGGDPTLETKEEAKGPNTGYIGRPDKADIPVLCAACHSNVSQMRQYDLQTDQYDQYQESIHGIRLDEGDENVATCFDCHGGHQILKSNDPASSVYPPNIPEMCAGCHADQELMAPYGIPINQFDLYRQSVHGHALLDNFDLRAPECATCHGTHGAAPPGFDEVDNVCGSCHSATQDHYLDGPHAGDVENAPKCVSCHGRYDVFKPTEALYLGAEPRHCGECHAPDSDAGQAVQTIYEAISTAATAYDEAELAIENARGVGMLVAPLEGRLTQANTDLITARALQHNLDLEAISQRAEKAQTVAEEVQASAAEAIANSIFRRQAMVIAVAAISLTIVALYLLKRELDRQLEESDS